MKNTVLGLVALALLIIGVVVYFSTASLQEKDLGQLKISKYKNGNTYCIYDVDSVLRKDVYAFLGPGDQVCIECCNGDPKQWPPKIDSTVVCYSTIRFTSQDGTAEYQCSLSDPGVKYCYDCPKAKGYYACP